MQHPSPRQKAWRLSCLTAACLLAPSVTTALAQSSAAPAVAASTPTPAPAPTAATEAATIESVTVSAQRRLQRLQDVPASVKAFSSEQIVNQGISSTQDFANLTPNMSFDNSFTYGNSFVVVRGVTQINNADSPVAVVIDGVPQNNQKQLKMNLFDIERIEVLKGPQGALYGRNAIGGAINIETKQPTNVLEGFAAAGVSNGGARDINGGVSGALVKDKVLFRLVGQGKSSNGLLTNTFRNATVDGIGHDNALRAKVLVMPGDGLQLDLRAAVVAYEAGATWDSIVPDNQPGKIIYPRSNLLGRTNGRSEDYSLKLRADVPVGTLTAITAFTDLKERYSGDVDFSNATELPRGFFNLGFQAGQGQRLSLRLLSQELRFTSPDNQPFRWIAGAYYLKTKRSLESLGYVDTTGQLNQIDDNAAVFVRNREKNDNVASAVFGQIDHDFAQGWTVAGALRYDRDLRQQVDLNTGGVREASFDKWQPKVTLTRMFAKDTLAYGTVSTGFRSGGFNSPGLAGFEPETLTNFEAGYKTVLLGNRLLLNTALFHARSKKFQYFYIEAASASQIIDNIDHVDINGVDLDWRWLPLRGLEIDGGLGITRSIIKRNSDDPSSVGKHTPKNVPFKLNLGVQYTTPVAAGAEALARVDYERRDKKYWHPDNAAVSPAANLWGLRIALRGPADRWSVALHGRNLTNHKYYADYNAKRYGGFPYDLGSLAPLRSYSLEAKVRF